MLLTLVRGERLLFAGSGAGNTAGKVDGSEQMIEVIVDNDIVFGHMVELATSKQTVLSDR